MRVKSGNRDYTRRRAFGSLAMHYERSFRSKPSSGWRTACKHCPMTAVCTHSTRPNMPPASSRESRPASRFQNQWPLLRNTSTISLLDGCVVSLPCHPQGTLPVGFMIAGPAMSDQKILAVAAPSKPLCATIDVCLTAASSGCCSSPVKQGTRNRVAHSYRRCIIASPKSFQLFNCAQFNDTDATEALSVAAAQNKMMPSN